MSAPQPPSSPPADGDPWPALAEELRCLLAQLDTASCAPARLQNFAVGYASLTGAYLRAIAVAGRSSMRAEAVAKALDLRTPKSALLAFLGRA